MRDGRVKTLGRRILSPILGQPRLQPVFQDLYHVALARLGYGEGDNPATSGERGALNYVHSRLQPNARVTVFDVGSNKGQYAEQVLELWGDRADLWCFEPSRPTFQMLSERLGGRRHVTLENLGLSDTAGRVPLYSRGEGSKVASLYKRRTSPWELSESEEIEVTALDSYCAEHQIEGVDFLKLDVEGHELRVLQGGSRMLESGAVRFVQFEFSAASIDSRVFFRDYWELLSPRFALYRVLAHGLTPVRSYNHSREVFDHATNYLAERR